MEKPASRSSFSASSGGPAALHDDAHLASKLRGLAAVDAARMGATALALLMGMTVLGVSGNTLAVYDHTKLPASTSSGLPGLWPDAFNIRPTVSLVAGSAVVVVANLAGLVGGKVPTLRANKMAHTSTSFAAPLVGLIAALVAVIFFYAVNASEEVDTFLSWTCRWKQVPMTAQPRWDTLCSQSWTGVYLAILLIPVEAAALGMAVWCKKEERYVDEYVSAQRK